HDEERGQEPELLAGPMAHGARFGHDHGSCRFIGLGFEHGISKVVVDAAHLVFESSTDWRRDLPQEAPSALPMAPNRDNTVNAAIIPASDRPRPGRKPKSDTTKAASTPPRHASRMPARPPKRPTRAPERNAATRNDKRMGDAVTAAAN